jgi:HemY protein
MRFVIWFILLFVAAVVAASALGTNDGLVSLYWHQHRVDISLNLFLLVLIGGCFAFVSTIKAINSLVGLPRRAHAWRTARRDRTAQAALREALAQYFGGRYSRSHKASQRALHIQAQTPDLVQDSEFTVLGHLLAAGSLHKMHDRAQRDEQLGAALKLSSTNVLARPAHEGASLLAAEWALDDRNAERAWELLSALPPGVARRAHALRLRLQAARLAGLPQDALRTARLLVKHQAISSVAARGLLRSLAFELLEGACDIDQVRRVWWTLDGADRKDPLVAARAATRLAFHGGQPEARSWLAPFWDALSSGLADDERRAIALALVPTLDGMAPDWLPRIEAAVRAHPTDPALAFAAGCAFSQCQLWGKALLHLERAAPATELDNSTRRHAWLVLAKLAKEQGNTPRAAVCYETAANLP